jgi:ABC-2 type transport system ATP-binding protein
MITVDGLTVRYGDVTALAGVSLALAEPRVHGIIGRNGAGKTTFLDALYGLVRPSAGGVLRDGAPLPRADVGYLPAQPHFYPRLTGREYLAVFRTGPGGFDVEEWNAVFELPLERLVETYSLGMRKKLALMGVLSLGRPVLLLDEPYNGLDLETNQVLGRLLRALAGAGKTVIVTSHVLGTLTDGCDEIHLLAAHRFARSFGPDEFGGLGEHLLDDATALKLERVGRLAAGA